MARIAMPFNRPAVVVKSLPGEDEVLAFPVVGVDHAAGGEAPEVAAGLGGVELAHRRYRLHTVQSSVWRVLCSTGGAARPHAGNCGILLFKLD